MGTLEPHGIGAWEAGSEDSGAGARGIELFETEVELGEKKNGVLLGNWQCVDSLALAARTRVGRSLQAAAQRQVQHVSFSYPYISK